MTTTEPYQSSPTSPTTPPTRSIESLLSEISARGWFLSNLFQLDNRRWQANLRNGERSLTTEYGRGLTPVAALNSAIDAMLTGKHTKVKPQTVVAFVEAPPPKIDLVALGLVTPKPISRRF